MPILVDGVEALSVAYSGLPRTVLSGGLLSRLYSPNASSVLLTTNVPPYGSFSVVASCDVDYGANFDVTLGLDWAPYLRDSLLNAGLRLDSTFDPLRFLLDPSRPLSSRTLVEPQPVSVNTPQIDPVLLQMSASHDDSHLQLPISSGSGVRPGAFFYFMSISRFIHHTSSGCL
ncbi:hypothetical protein C8R43DRAFT_1051356 [Mycena crocata]|nr:hypothetical protein C8R43DRAFT_1051356 [Mycena crocata]